MTTTQLDPPTSVRQRCTLERIDYADAFALTAAGPTTAEDWARTLLEDAPLATRIQLLSGWAGLGIRLSHPGGEGNILGWPVLHRTEDHVLLGADSWLGLHGQLLFLLQPGGVLLSTLLQLDGPAARTAWAGTAPIHQRVVPALLRRAERRLGGQAA